MQGATTSAMPWRIVKERQRRRWALGGGTLRASGIYGRVAASQLLRDVASIASSSLLALTCNSHLPDPPHFHHALLLFQRPLAAPRHGKSYDQQNDRGCERNGENDHLPTRNAIEIVEPDAQILGRDLPVFLTDA